MSAYKIETWLKRGFTEEEARYQIAIRRPTNILYWMNKYGLSEEEAILKKAEHQKNGGNKSAERSTDEIRKSSVRCVEFWTNKGFTEEEAIVKVSEVQQTFTLEKCIDKHGIEEGTRIWQDRQDRWQDTLNSKSEEEKLEINKKKNSKKLSTYVEKYGENEGLDRFKEHILCISGEYPPQTIDEVKDYVLSRMRPLDFYLPISKIEQRIPNYIWELVDKPKDMSSWLSSFINFISPYGDIIFKTRGLYGKGLYQMYVDDKLLRSGNEVYFYQILCELGLKHHIDYEIERYYTNSKMRCDFYLIRGNLWIELMGSTDDDYIQKMLYKQDTFGSVLLKNKTEYLEFLQTYYDAHYNKHT